MQIKGIIHIATKGLNRHEQTQQVSANTTDSWDRGTKLSAETKEDAKGSSQTNLNHSFHKPGLEGPRIMLYIVLAHGLEFHVQRY